MTTNSYFTNDDTGPGRKSEQDLIETNVIESIQLAGIDFYYIKRDLVKIDPILNEDPLSQFQEYSIIEMYPINFESFGGQGHLLGKFGLDVSDTLELLVSKKRCHEELDKIMDEGDLLYWPLTQSLWQINLVEDEVPPYYQLSNLYTLNVKCTRFVYGYEEFSTGVEKIDEINEYSTPFERNDEINDEAKKHLDFEESNPFGSISE